MLGLHFAQTFHLRGVSFQFGLLLVQQIVEFHHFALPVLGLALPLVAFSQRPQLLLLDAHCEVVQAFRQRPHGLVEGDHFRDELHGEGFKVV